MLLFDDLEFFSRSSETANRQDRQTRVVNPTRKQKHQLTQKFHRVQLIEVRPEDRLRIW